MHKEINIIHRGKDAFALCMAVVFNGEYGQELTDDRKKMVRGYYLDKSKNVITLAEHKGASEDSIADMIFLPYAMTEKQAVDFFWGWLESVDPVAEEPDTDGSVEKGFRITTDGTSFMHKNWATFISISPVWLVYGK